MAKMWAGRTAGLVDETADAFNSSISFDQRMIEEDIKGSIAHTKMLSKQAIISSADANQMIAELEKILDEILTGSLTVDLSCEDVHMFVEQVLTQRLGDLGKKLHTARSRNDQVALDLRMYLRRESDEITALLHRLCEILLSLSETYQNVMMPGYTHMQRAQPVLFSQHLLAYVQMFFRDLERLSDAKKRLNASPIGALALAGTSFPTDRQFEAEQLGFNRLCTNSMDAVSDRDFGIEFLSDASMIMMHLSRFCEEIILWCSMEFRFITLSDRYTTGSSIMPQKKNPDMAELIRGKTGRVYGDLITLLTVMKGLPLAYNKDMQEDKEALFDACDTVKNCLKVFCGMISEITIYEDRMKNAVAYGFLNATDLADYLVGKGLSFRDAYRISGRLVSYCIEEGITLGEVSLEKLQTFSTLFDKDVYIAIAPETCVSRRTSEGGTSPASVAKQISEAKLHLKEIQT